MNNETIISKIHEYEFILTETIQDWLEEFLPPISDDWWYSLVLEKLSDMQYEKVIEKNINSLSGLDLASLLKIIDKNWFTITRIYFLNNNNRMLVKEMMNVRNKWAHITSNDIIKEDVITDFSIILDLLNLFDADKKHIKSLKEFISIFELDGFSSKSSNETFEKITVVDPKTSSEIILGTMISLINDPRKVGAIVGIDDNRYSVLIDNKISCFYREQFNVYHQTNELEHTPLNKLKIALTAYEIMNTNNSSLYSLNTSRIDFVPYQFRPALKLIHSDSPRILIADDVGVGKTIETGLIIKELEARSEINSILVICPRPLVVENKWQNEMKKFDEDFVSLDNQLLKQCINESNLDGSWPDRYRKAIISFSSFTDIMLEGDIKNNGSYVGLNNLDFIPHFDLVIVDEAHHIRNSNTLMYQGTELFCREADSVVFLTATPLQNSNDDLYTLLNLLRPDMIYDKNTFFTMLEPNKYINRMLSIVRRQEKNWINELKEELNKVLQTNYGSIVIKNNPVLLKINSLINKSKFSRNDKILLIESIEKLHTFDSIINRTRRKDIDEFCIRRTETIMNCFTKYQQQLYNKLIEFEDQSLSMIYETNNTRFMMCTLMRQAASCIYGLAPFINDFIDKRINQIQYDGELYEEEFTYNDEQLNIIKKLSKEISNLVDNIEEEDTKFENLYKIIEEKYMMENNKIIIFSSFRHTLRYLKSKLDEYGVKSALIDGSIKDNLRRQYTMRFKLDKSDDDAIDVLLFSEVGCEGLDYQFCDTMINYDLPWNPMRIEQRIGRIDRRGQKSDTVKIYNLITEGTIDASIYERCLLKIGIFENSIGDCGEILGSVSSQIAKVMLDPKLSNDERKYKIEKIADNDILKINEIRSLEENEKGLFGFDLKNYIIDSQVQKAENQWISPNSIQNLVDAYLNDFLGAAEYIKGKQTIKNIKLSADKRLKLLKELKNNNVAVTRSSKIWKKYLKSHSNPNLQVTFDSDYAKNDYNVHFITQMHPLVQQAAAFESQNSNAAISVSVNDNNISSGNYPFIIYSWNYLGLKNRSQFKFVCQNSYISDNMLDLLSYSNDFDLNLNSFKSEWKSLDDIHHNMWIRARDKFISENIDGCNFRVDQLKVQYDSRIKILEKRIDTDTDYRIKRMHQSQMERIKYDLDIQKKKYNDIATKTDIHATLLVKGVLHVY